MKIGVFGAGAMGGSLCALLVKNGVSCELICRREEQAERINGAGLILSGGEEGEYPVCARLMDGLSDRYDLLFLATKQKDNGEIARFLVDFLAEDGALVTVQNGFPEPLLAEIFGADRVYGCALSWSATRITDEQIAVTSENGYHFSLGAYGKGERLAEIVALLQKLGEVQTGNLLELRYAKLAINGCFSTLSAISGLTFGSLAKGYRKYVLTLMRETFRVARAAGCKKLPLNGYDLFKVFGGFLGSFLLPVAMKKYRDSRSGMLADLQSGKRCEIDFISGMVVSEAKKYGVRVPMQKRAVALVHDIENGLAELAEESIFLLDEGV